MNKKYLPFLNGILTVIFTLSTKVATVCARAGSAGGGHGGGLGGVHGSNGGHSNRFSLASIFFFVCVCGLLLLTYTQIDGHIRQVVKKEQRAFHRQRQIPWQDLPASEQDYYLNYYQQLQAAYDRFEYRLAKRQWLARLYVFLYWRKTIARSQAKNLTTEIFAEAKKCHRYSNTTISTVDALKKLDLPSGKRLILYQFTGADQTLNVRDKVISERKTWQDIYVFSSYNRLIRILYNGAGINSLLIDERVNSKNKLIAFWRNYPSSASTALLIGIFLCTFICYTALKMIAATLMQLPF